MIFNKIKEYLAIGAVTLVLLIVTNAITGFKAFGWGEDKVKAEWVSSQLIATNKKITVKGRQDEIQNAPVDSIVTNRRLFNRTF